MQKKVGGSFRLTLEVEYESIFDNEVIGDDQDTPEYMESEEVDRRVKKIVIITDDESLDITKKLSMSQIEKILFSTPHE
jgi:hypothetical protein